MYDMMSWLALKGLGALSRRGQHVKDSMFFHSIRRFCFLVHSYLTLPYLVDSLEREVGRFSNQYTLYIGISFFATFL